MHLPPTTELPPPPVTVEVKGELPDAESLRLNALGRRPDLRALADRIAAEQATLATDQQGVLSRLEAFFMYDRFMGNVSDNRDLATMVGVKMNVPVRLERRSGAVAEAHARIAQRQAELDRLADGVSFQVQEAHAQATESERTVRLYEGKILPDADLNVKTARADYKTGLVPANSVVESEHERAWSYTTAITRRSPTYFRRLANSGTRRRWLARACVRSETRGNPADADRKRGVCGRVSRPGHRLGPQVSFRLRTPGDLRSRKWHGQETVPQQRQVFQAIPPPAPGSPAAVPEVSASVPAAPSRSAPAGRCPRPRRR